MAVASVKDFWRVVVSLGRGKLVNKDHREGAESQVIPFFPCVGHGDPSRLLVGLPH